MQKTSKIALFLSLTFVALVYFPTLFFDFVNRDDHIHLIENPLITGKGSPSLLEYLTVPTHGYPIPVAVLTYKLEYALVGLTPWLYHFTNLCLFLWVCYLVFRIARRLEIDTLGAIAGLLLVGLHPASVESVAWITSRKTLLGAIFALYGFIIFFEKLGKKKTPHPFWIGVYTWFGLLCKPTLIFLPPLFAAWEVLLKLSSPLKAFLRYLPAFGVCVFMVLVSYFQSEKSQALAHDFSFFQWIREIWYALGFNLDLILMIKEPAVVHHLRDRPPAFAPLVDLMPFFTAGVFYAFYRLLPSLRKILLFAGTWIIFSLFPGINFIPTNRYLADTYAFYPLFGFAWAFGAFIEHALEKATKRSLKIGIGGALALFLSLCLASSFNQIPVWQNGITMWQSVERKNTDAPMYCTLVGHAYTEWRQIEKALAQYQHCAEVFGAKNYQKDIGLSLYLLKKYDEAYPLLEEASQTENPPDPQVLRAIDDIHKARP